MVEIRALSADDDLSAFHSGEPALDTWLVWHARPNQRRGFSATYVAVDGKTIVGYVALTASSLDRVRVKRGQGPTRWPALLVARMAVAQTCQRRGVGVLLVIRALEVAVQQLQLSGCAAITVDAKVASVAFYRRFGFRDALHLPHDPACQPSDPLPMYLEIADAISTLARLSTPSAGRTS